MAVFAYKALDNRATAIQGTISADNLRTARDLLRSRGLLVESVTAQAESNHRRWWPFRRHARHMAKRVAMVRELSTLLSAGIPLLDALDSQTQQHTGSFQASLLMLRDRVAAGSGLAEAMREQPAVYDALSVHMVEVGENSGTLDVVLDQLANFSERYLQLKDRVVNALFYPVVVFLLSMGVGMFLMTVVVPMLLDNLLEAGKTIPWPTRVLKGMSDFVRGHGLEILALATLAVVAFFFLLRTERGRRLWHRTLLRLPMFGTMARKQEVARMALIVSTLLRSGVVLLQSLEIAGRAMRNVVLRDALTDSQQAIQSGREIGEALEATGQFSPTVVQIFSVGQQSGKLEEMLQRLADTYDRQVATLSMRMATLLEPVLIVGLALFVGFILFATVLPILEAGNVL
ncbi:MAG: type II secretion system F family protein [Planctomycetales bacterium]|nr:type II secretion system F family protein [Planctomycetales bacterium]